ncbi:transglycosylase family protein [Nesterenkonia marinintestina]|uniref:transglycosylase family protein n=1 Tax=Nesterenkonia marinintestina TaxID=2979865 RepID=UPI0036F411B5
MCESTGDWSINTGNGYYGGLQFSLQSWQAVGGTGYPHQASKAEQINRAHELWKIQGWGAWPSCSSRLGLSGDPGGASGSATASATASGTGTAVSSAPRLWSAMLSVPLRGEPSSMGEKLAQIPRGVDLAEVADRGSWVQVRFSQLTGETLLGWVSTDFVAQS